MSADADAAESTRAAVRDAADLREAADLIDGVARRRGGATDVALRDCEHIVESVAAIIEEEEGEISIEELQQRVYPTGGSR